MLGRMVSRRKLRGCLYDHSVSSRLLWNGSYVLQMEQHSGNLCFSLEALGYFFQTLRRVGYTNRSLQSIAVGLLRVAEAGTGAASRRQQQRGISTSPKPEH